MVFCHYYAIIIYYHAIHVYIYTGWWYPLKNMTSSVGVMTFPI